MAKNLLHMIGMTICLIMACTATAQMTIVPYHMSFEATETSELQNWHMNNGADAPSCVDQWMVGADQASDGVQSLYISDNDNSAHYGVGTNIQFAYRDFLLPYGNYSISFDWKNYGGQNSTLHVGWAPATTRNLTCEAISSTNVLAVPYVQYIVPAASSLHGQRYWQNVSFNVGSNGTTTYRLYFAWCSSNTDTIGNNPSACIDNLEIRENLCPKPTSISVEASCSPMVITWTGASDYYEVGYRRVGENNWHTHSGLFVSTGTGTLSVGDVEDGLYDVRVRSICGGDTSVYLYKNAIPLFCPESHCINYVNLHDTTGEIVCQYGSITSSGEINPGQTRVGVVDYGPADKNSRHTVNWDIDEYDERTNYRLPKIPIGEVASVRLGNWETSAEWESITYNYYVDSTSSILLLKYATVLEDAGHTMIEQPRFTFVVRDENGQVLDPQCLSVDIRAGAHAGNTGSGWHYEPNVSWKEWTTHGVNLTPYIGQTLQITLTTYDCTLSGHYGYAYFCLGCTKAEIEKTSCGDDSNIIVQAPDGFAYEWRSILNHDSIISRERALEVEPYDTTTYICRLISLENRDCFFELHGRFVPRFPVASFAFKYCPINCENRVQFTNQSHVLEVSDEYIATHHYDEPCDEWEWIINNERIYDANPTYIFPQEGGSFTITLMAFISHGRCMDDTTFTVVIPKIGDASVEIYDEICTDDLPYDKHGFQISEPTGPGDYSFERVFAHFTGCDSTTILHLTIHPKLEAIVDNVMPYKCIPEVDEEVTLALPFTWVQDVGFTHLDVVPSAEAIAAGFNPLYSFPVDSVKTFTKKENGRMVYIPLNGSNHWIPGTYGFTMLFHSEFGCDFEALTHVELRHSLLVVNETHGSIYVVDSEHNGGYAFDSFQWYKNGQKIEGATSDHLDLTDDNKDSVFYCMVTIDGGKPISTCPIRYDWTSSNPHEWANGVEDSGLTDLNSVESDLLCVPTIALAGSSIFVSTNEALQIIDIMGRVVASYPQQTDAYHVIAAPQTSGMYVVKSQSGAMARILVQ